MRRLLTILSFIIVTFLVATGQSYAQEIPGMENWPQDSVVRGSIYKYTVQGDQNFTAPSTFEWSVIHGRLFYDKDTLNLAGDGTYASIPGDSTNTTELYVIWDQVDYSLDTGYVFVHEISSKGCEHPIENDKAYQGMMMIIVSPPTVRFLVDEINLCSYDYGTEVVMEIEGMAPFEVIYRFNGIQDTLLLEKEKLTDYEGDGRRNNYIFQVNDFNGTADALSYRYELISASTDGIEGYTPPPRVCNVFVKVQPPAPVIFYDNVEVTTGRSAKYTAPKPVPEAEIYHWNVYRASDNYKVHPTKNLTPSGCTILWDDEPGLYFITLTYSIDTDGANCESPADTLWVEVFPEPTIKILNGDMTICSALNDPVNRDSLTFELEYTGATEYKFSCYIIDDVGNVVSDTVRMELVKARKLEISFEHKLMNTRQPAQTRNYTVVFMDAENREGVPIQLLDPVPIIKIRPKPFIDGDIYFYN